MKAHIEHNGKNVTVDFSKPIDISLALSDSDENPIAWYLDKPQILPVVMGDWVGKVSEGKSSTNFNNVFFNPHGHGTHTECLGHITKDFYSISDVLKTFFFTAELVSVTPELSGADAVITSLQLQKAIAEKRPEAIVIRTLPNDGSKKSRKYSNTNPPFLSDDAALWLREIGVNHLLIDLPSVDKEHDEGKLVAHKAFWNVTDVQHLNPDARLDATITELIYVPDEITDGTYLLNLQVANFENDASPGRPVLYKVEL
ncbi:cyclase family protein [Flavobacterium silvaticum]|uniref:Cyclase family protein n=1 Tax=Flavobacterium silvaticum TaxID=1852020 RepID=A0A972FSC9_9FLAO|nr:cyclase family protein [Flavobacterium silvaticum]NMH28474.1 cyclase family protein [Flavobacterium silvaticum]